MGRTAQMIGVFPMPCTFHESKKETRVEIGSINPALGSLSIGVLLFAIAANASLLMKLFVSPEGFTDLSYVINFAFVGIGNLALLVLGYFEVRSASWKWGYALSVVGYVAMSGIVAAFFIWFFRDGEAIWIASNFAVYFWFMLMPTVFFFMNLAIRGHRDAIEVACSTISVHRTWLGFYTIEYTFDRQFTHVECEWLPGYESQPGMLPPDQTAEGPTTPRMVHAITIRDSTRALRLGLLESEADLRRLYEVLASPPVASQPQTGTWGFSDSKFQPWPELGK